MPPESPQVAVAVVSWNTRDLLGACLESLSAPAASGLVEVWVVDNGSRDGSAELVRQSQPWANLIETGSNLGFGAAVNLVAARTNTPWIVPANADIEVRDGAIEALLTAGRDHPDAGVIAPQLVFPDGSPQASTESFPSLGLAVMQNFGLLKLIPGLGDRLAVRGHWPPNRARTIDWAWATFLLVRRAAWEHVGGFDERQWMYAEDLDLGWRLAKAGWTTWYEPSAKVVHHLAAAADQVWGSRRYERIALSMYAWTLRRQGLAALRAQALANVVGGLVRWVLLWPLALLYPDRFAAPRRQWIEWARFQRHAFVRPYELERHR